MLIALPPQGSPEQGSPERAAAARQPTGRLPAHRRAAGRAFVPGGGAEGVIVAEADEMGGFALWVDGGGLLHHSYSTMGVDQYQQVATQPLPAGDVTVRMQFDADEPKPGTGGNVTLWANDAKIGEGRMDRTVALRFSFYADMDIGRDNGNTVHKAYRDKAPYAFTGTVKKVVFDLKPAAHEDETALHETTHHGATAAAMSG
jgi:arylsulfatase